MNNINSKKPLLQMSLKELSELLKQNGQEGYRAKQIFEWVYKKKVSDFTQMTNLSKSLIEFLEQNLTITTLQTDEVLESQKNIGTYKLLLKTYDHQYLEAIMMPNSHGSHTLCISSQLGCDMGCDFCATGKMGLKRSLAIEEVLGQFFLSFQKHPISNIVFMGMGEPFLNDDIFEIIHRLTSPEYFGFPDRSITVSTVGILEGIKKMVDFKQVGLALSYHSSIPETREVIFPILHMRHSLDEIIDTLIYYHQRTKKRITLEYTLMKGINDTPEEARALGVLFEKMYFFLNIIPFNSHAFSIYKSPTKQDIQNFMSYIPSSIPVNIRYSKGQDIFAACGQLAYSKDIANTD